MMLCYYSKCNIMWYYILLLNMVIIALAVTVVFANRPLAKGATLMAECH